MRLLHLIGKMFSPIVCPSIAMQCQQPELKTEVWPSSALRTLGGRQGVYHWTVSTGFSIWPSSALRTLGGRQGVYHWTVSTGYSIAESTNFALGSPEELVDTLDGWVAYLGAAAGAALGWLSSAPDGSRAAQVHIAWSVLPVRERRQVLSL